MGQTVRHVIGDVLWNGMPAEVYERRRAASPSAMVRCGPPPRDEEAAQP